MAEPMEETRLSISFATEPITASLRQAIVASSASGRRGSTSTSTALDDDLELDEVEIQKGLSQVAKGLQFLHDSAKLVHGNLHDEAVVINAKGDWKLAGFGLSTYLFDAQGVPAKWEFPDYDHSMPESVQRDYDFIAPEYILDESPPAPSNDMYSLGCLLHAIHTKAGPPFSNRQSLQNARMNMEEGLSRGLLRSQWRKMPDETQAALSQLLTRYPSSRLSAASFLSHNYFSSLLVSTLNFIARDAFASQSSEAQAGFLKGLVSVLPRFSDKVNRRKVLPSLLEETRKANLVPFLLPNILYIAGKMDTESFRLEVLPSLKPLFALKEPPQALIALLDNLQLLLDKCSPAVFRDEVMPLVYHSLDSDNPVVLERALRVIPGLSETLDYTTVKQTLFPKIATVFTKTTMLSVKVNTLICFHSMIKTLDKFTLTEKLVPLLSKIKTKEPSVMIATLAVHEAMGSKVEVEAIATLILPQLWAMSMGPLLNADQFAKFMSVIKRLGARVEEEHSKHLSELRRLEESSGTRTNGSSGNNVMDFESLVRGGGFGLGQAAKKEVQNDFWSDDSPKTTTTATFSPIATPVITPQPTGSFQPAQNGRPAAVSRLSTSKASSRATNPSLGAQPLPSSAFNASAFPSPSPPPLPAASVFPSSFPVAQQAPPPPPSNNLKSFAALQPSRAIEPSSMAPRNAGNSASTASSYNAGRPNYDLGSIPTSIAAPSVFGGGPNAPQKSQWNVVPSAAPPGFAGAGAVLQPKVVAQNKPSADAFGDWSDFDPLK